ncbi:AMP-binding protein [Burkholderia sp. Ax-1724]|uniref:AMP-binding protein n=1 Tax=Burkholderia sp. Ax-1724 TaxID=2608336 RepID=UPI00141E8DA4|nr:AMP-binding protein [Burkholderia sp. Ax-1724]NIF50920.1 AMP-binding protein [Burkholderia sp. Ax-1724]
MTSHPFPTTHEPASIIETLAAWSEREPDRTALTILRDGETIESESTFSDLNAGMRCIAAGLRSRVAAGARVILLLPTSFEFVCTFYGCLAAGMIAVPAFHPQQPRKIAQWKKLQAIVENSGASLVVAPVGSIDKLRMLREKEDLFAGCDFATYEELCTAGAPAADAPLPLPTGSDLAFLQYTSGSTGTPKGVMITHANIVDNQRVIADLMGHSSETRMLSWLPLYHDMGLSMMLHLASIGTSVILMSPFAFIQQPGRWLRAIAAHRANTSGGPNFAYQLAALALQLPEDTQPQLDLSAWKVAFCGAEPINRNTVATFLEAAAPHGFAPQAFYPCYGMAEATLLITGVKHGEGVRYLEVDNRQLSAGVIERAQAGQADIKSLVSCGSTGRGTEIRIVDSAGAAVADQYRVGEIWARGDGIGIGYYGNQQATQDTFRATLPDEPPGAGGLPFMRTGDLGAFIDGELFVTGRVKDMLIIRGRNLYPQDVEECVQDAVPELRRGCGAAVSVTVDGEEKLVIVQEVGRAQRRAMDARATLRQMIVVVGEDFGITPHAVVLVEPATIEKTSSGKIARALCRRAYVQGELRTVASWTEGRYDGGEPGEAPTPRTGREDKAAAALLVKRDLERCIARIVAAHLKIGEEQVSRTTPWVEMGFDSMSALQFALKVQHATGVAFDAAALWDCANVEQLAAHLADMRGAGSGASATAEPAPPPATQATAATGEDERRSAEQLMELSDAEAEALLLKELDR